jgi:spore germination protein KB
MIEKGKISNWQTLLLLIATVLPTVIFSLPALTVAAAQEDAWLSVIIAAIAGIVVILTTVFLGRKFPGKTIVEYCEVITGKIPGKLIGLIYIWFFLYMTALTAREFSEFMVTVFMDEMPTIIFIATLIFACALAIYQGLEVIGRINEVLIMLVIGFFLLSMLMTMSELQPFRILPILANGIIPVLKGSIHVAGRMGEVFVIAFLLPYMNRTTKAGRTGIISVLVLAFLFILSIIVSVLCFGALETGRLLFPNYMVARNIIFPDVLERQESMFMLIWVTGTFLKLTICYYITVLATGQWLNLGSYRPLILPLGTIIVVLSFIIHVSIAELVAFLDKIWGPYAFSIELGIPVILLILAVIRRKGVKTN